MTPERATELVVNRTELPRIRTPTRYDAQARVSEIECIANREAGTDKDLLATMMGGALEHLAREMLDDGVIQVEWDRHDGCRRLRLVVDAKRPS